LEAKAAARAYQDDWRKGWPLGAVSWTREAGFHLTLRFLGEIGDREAAEIGDRLADLATLAPLPLAFAGPLCYPNARRPSILAVDISGPPGLADLAGSVDRALKGMALARRDKPFCAHLTLGRVRDRHAPVPEPPEPGPGMTWLAEQVTLYKSTLSPQGSRYDELVSITLGR
jgi:2'-5' RNA ligase